MLINNDEYLQILKEACDFIYKAQYNAVVGANYALVKRNLNKVSLLGSENVFAAFFVFKNQRGGNKCECT